MASLEASTTGVVPSVDIASDRLPAGSASSARTTSVVVPEREMATTKL